MKQFAISTARKSGKYLLANFRHSPKLLLERAVAKKIVTKHDKKSDKLIIAEIIKRFPKHNILTEESGFIDKKSEFTWVIDPLDGSSNFANGNPFFSVSIALMKNDELILGVIFAPYLKELFVAEKGKGAYLNGKKIYVSKVRSFTKSYFLSCEGGESTCRRIAEINHLFHKSLLGLRKLGSAALESAYVAAGRAEAYFVTKINPWDVAAGILLVREAGGKVTDFNGKGWKAKRSDMVFSNGKVHGKILSKLKKEIEKK